MRSATFLAIALLASGPALACDDAPQPVVSAGIVQVSGDAGGAGRERPPVYVLVRNHAREAATFDLVIVDRLEGLGIARERIVDLGPGRSRTVPFDVDVDPARLRAVALASSAKKHCPSRPPAAPPVERPPEEPPIVDGAARVPTYIIPLDSTARTGVPSSIPRNAWNDAVGLARATSIGPSTTRFEITARGLQPSSVYSLWWVDGLINPTAGPLAAEPNNVTRTAPNGSVRVDVVADFPMGKHDRIVVVFHEDGRTENLQRDMIGKTIFAQLVGALPLPGYAGHDLASGEQSGHATTLSSEEFTGALSEN
jgi:hypothetical protein